MNATDHSAHLATLLAKERGSLTDFLVSLAVFDAQRLWLDLGYATLWAYLTRELRLSETAAYYRAKACALIQQFPEIVDPLREGKLCLTIVFQLAKVLTRENVGELLPSFFYLSKRQAMELVAELKPAEQVPERTVVTAGIRAPAPEPLRLDATRDDAPTGLVPAQDHATVSQQHARRDEIVPLTAELRRLHVNVSKRFLEKLDAAKDALSHSRPKASVEDILEAGLDLILKSRDERVGLVKKPLRTPRPTRTLRIPAHIRRVVWTRDAGKCQFPLVSGGICGSTCRVQFDHLNERALGGPVTVETVALHCDIHNILRARRTFGDACMDRYTRKARPGPRTG